MDDKIRGLLSDDSPLMQGLRFFSNLVILHFMILITSCGLVTVGASVTAGYSVVQRMVEKRLHVPVWRCYMRSFRENFRQSTVVFLAFAGIALALLLDLFFGLSNFGRPMGVFLCCFSAVGLLFLSFTGMLLFPLLARFGNTTAAHIRNAFFLSIRHIGVSLTLLGIRCLAVGILFWAFGHMPVILFWGGVCGISVVILLSTLCEKHILQFGKRETE